MDENLEALRKDADMKAYAECEEPWRMKPAERGINIMLIDSHDERVEYGLRIAAESGNIIVIGRPEHITADRIVKALGELDPNIKARYIEACKNIAKTEQKELLDEVERLKELNKPFERPPIIIQNTMRDYEQYPVVEVKPHKIKHKEFKRTKPRRK